MTSMKGRLALLGADVRGRVRRSAAQRAEILAAFDQGGVSAAEFARLVRVKYPTWAGRLHQRGRPRGEVGKGRSPAVPFVEAAVPTPEAFAPLELELPGHVKLRLTEPARLPLVVALLRGLARCRALREAFTTPPQERRSQRAPTKLAVLMLDGWQVRQHGPGCG